MSDRQHSRGRGGFGRGGGGFGRGGGGFGRGGGGFGRGDGGGGRGKDRIIGRNSLCFLFQVVVISDVVVVVAVVEEVVEVKIGLQTGFNFCFSF
jgi:hypothetical protein